MIDPNSILDQAQAELRAGRKAEAWKLAAPIVKADPNNARAWRVLADISDKDAPERASGYRAKAEAAEANSRLGPPAGQPPQQLRPQQPPPPAQPQPYPQPPTAYQQPMQFAPQPQYAPPVFIPP